MRSLLFGLVLVVGFAPPLPGSAQEPPAQEPPAQAAPAGPRLKLTFEGNGRVTLVANGATLREILNEWTRLGGTPFVGAERLAGGPLTLQYESQSEVDVVKSLLRSASGFVLAPRRAGSVGASQFEAVYVVATSNAVASTGTTYVPAYQQPQVSTTGFPDQEIPPVDASRGAGPGPQPQPAAPPPPPDRPVGVSPIAVPIVPVGGSTNPPPTNPPPTTTGRGGRGGR
jgi:hypothetical protein